MSVIDDMRDMRSDTRAAMTPIRDDVIATARARQLMLSLCYQLTMPLRVLRHATIFIRFAFVYYAVACAMMPPCCHTRAMLMLIAALRQPANRPPLLSPLRRYLLIRRFRER